MSVRSHGMFNTRGVKGREKGGIARKQQITPLQIASLTFRELFPEYSFTLTCWSRCDC